MFLKVMHFEADPKFVNSTSYTLYEGKIINVIWENEKEKTPLMFVFEGQENVSVRIEGKRRKVVYIMNDEGKTIERIEYNPLKNRPKDNSK